MSPSDGRAARMTNRQRVKRLVTALFPAKKVTLPDFGTPEWHRWICGDVTKLCGHGYHQGGDGIVCDGEIVEGLARAECLCDCHRAIDDVPEWVDPEFLARLRATNPKDMATFDIEWDREDQRWSR